MWNVSSYMQKWSTAMQCGEPLTVDQLIERLQIISAFGHGGDIVKVYTEDTQSYDPVVGCFSDYTEVNGTEILTKYMEENDD